MAGDETEEAVKRRLSITVTDFTDAFASIGDHDAPREVPAVSPARREGPKLDARRTARSIMAKRNPSGDVVLRRKMRRYQANHRGSKLSYLERYENAVVCLAWEVGALSEGQASKALGVGRVEARDMRNEAITAGIEIGEALWRAARAKKR